MLVGISTLGNPDNWLCVELHRESGTCLVNKMGLNRRGGLKVLNMLMLHWSTGPWRPFSYLGEAISCCQADLAAVGSLNIIVIQCIPFPNRAKARWGEVVTCCSRKGLSQSMLRHPLSHVLLSIIGQLLSNFCIMAA